MPANLNTALVTDSTRMTECNDTSNRSNDQNDKHNDRRQIFQKISQQEFEDVVFTPERKMKKSRNKIINGNGNCSSVSDVDCDLSVLNTDKINANDAKTTHSSLLTLSVDDDLILRTERNLESIQRDVESKEKLLADVLDFDLSKYMTSSQISGTNSNVSQSIDTITYIDCKVDSNGTYTERKDEQDEYNEHSEHTETESGDEDVSYRTELKKLEDLGECRKKLLQGKFNEPSEQSNHVDGRKMLQTAGRNKYELKVEYHREFNKIS